MGAVSDGFGERVPEGGGSYGEGSINKHLHKGTLQFLLDDPRLIEPETLSGTIRSLSM